MKKDFDGDEVFTSFDAAKWIHNYSQEMNSVEKRFSIYLIPYFLNKLRRNTKNGRA